MGSYLGQNFLTDSSIVSRIAQTIRSLIEKTNSRSLIEVGPGKWALTKKIIGLTESLTVIEMDEKMIEKVKSLDLWVQSIQEWKASPSLSIVHADILQRDETWYSHDHTKTVVSGNLPYYITSPILRKFFGGANVDWAGGVFLIQKEVAEKIVHDAPKKSYLWWLLNYAHRVEYAFTVSAKAFTPAPKVTSAVIRILPKLAQDISDCRYGDLLAFLDRFSPFKRKTLGASAKIVAKHEGSCLYNIEQFAHLRLEELGWKEMSNIIS